MEDQNKPKKSWYKRWWGILIITIGFIFLVIFIGFIFLIYNIINNPSNYLTIKNPEIDIEKIKLIEGTNNFYLGSKDKAKVVIVEFSDFSCPICKNTFPKLRDLVFKYKDDVKLIYRDYPVISKESTSLSLAARCAGEQGLFWVMHDKLFINQELSTGAEIKALAEQIGVDINKFNSCFDKKIYMAQIYRDFEDGQNLEVVGTPTFFINGYPVSGDLPLENWEKIINSIINQ